MKHVRLLFVVLTVLAAGGCLSFGPDEETTSPSKQQVDRCRAEMYLDPSAKIVPLGYRLEGSGIDDALWFKFETDVADLADLFDSKVVDTSEFESAFRFLSPIDSPWWDVEGKDLLGEQVNLPNARFMNVGAEKIPGGYRVYIMWHET